jgi:hypothetical protein
MKRTTEASSRRDGRASSERYSDATVAGIRNLLQVRVERPPRPVEFAPWMSACEEAMGMKSGEAITACRTNGAEARSLSLPLYQPARSRNRTPAQPMTYGGDAWYPWSQQLRVGKRRQQSSVTVRIARKSVQITGSLSGTDDY